MNYNDIKDQVVTTTHSLRLIPSKLIDTLMYEHTYMRWYGGQWSNLEHPSVKCVIHALMITDNRRYHTVCTITVDDVPAFYFLSAGREGEDFQSYCVLSADAMKIFFRYMVEAAVANRVFDKKIPVGDVDEEVPDLTNFYQKNIMYGRKYYQEKLVHTPSDDVLLPLCRQ